MPSSRPLPLLRALALCLVLAAALLALGGCGTSGGDDPLEDTATDTTQSDGDTSVDPDSAGDTEPDTADPDATDGDGDTSVATDLRIPGLSGPVQAVYDADGLLHLQCLTDADCAAALGYFHAANRFFFMDFNRLNYRGQVGEVAPLDGDLGAGLLAEDISRRHFMTTRDGEPLEEVMVARLDEDARLLIERYADGVNAWLDDARAGRNEARLSTEYSLGLLYPGDAATRAERIRDWEPADSMAVALAVFDDLSNGTSEEVLHGTITRQMALLDPLLAADVLSSRPVFEVATMPASGVDFGSFEGDMLRQRFDLVAERLAPAEHLLADVLERMAELPRLERRGGGSNNWVLAPERTRDGNPMVANDPHLALFNPAIWFPAEIDSKTAAGATGTLHCAGGTFAGLPIVLTGHCEHVAWGVTVAYWDLTDVYVETLNEDGSAVIFEGNEVPILEREFTFMSNDQPVTRTLRWVPHHGPIISEDLDAGTALSVRWTVHEGTGAEDLSAFLGLMRAQDLGEARAALGELHNANQNFVVADDAGNIGWFPWVRLPQRPWDWSSAPPWLPLPGDGSAEWGPTHFLPSELPTMENPPAGFIATANQDATGAFFDGDPSENGGRAQQFGRAPGVRMQRIVDLLEAGGSTHTPETMLAVQADTFSLLGEVLVPAVLAASANTTLDPAAQATVDALAEWQFTCPTGLDGPAPDAPFATDPLAAAESIGCTAFHVVLFETFAHVLGDEALAADLGGASGSGLWYDAALRLVVESLLRPEVLTSGEVFWDDRATPDTVETRDDILLAALLSAAARLSAPEIAPEGTETGLGPDSNAWRWGRIHTVSMRSPYNSFQADFTAFNDGPYANDGGYLTVDVANPGNRRNLDFHHRAGASLRTVIELTPQGPVMRLQLPGGTSLDRQSGRYGQLVDEWLQNEPVTMPFGLDSVQQPQASFEVLPAP